MDKRKRAMGGARPGKDQPRKAPLKKDRRKSAETKYVPISKKIRDVKRLLNKVRKIIDFFK